MRLGYSVTSFFGPDRSPGDAAAALLERAQVAREAGYDYVEAGDHHAVAGAGYLQNVPTAARLTAVFDRVAAMFLLPLYDPVLVAEQAATLAAFAGEFDLWLAVGGGEEQFDAFGVPLAERAGRFEEGLRLLEALWTEDEVTVDGEFYAVDGVSVNPKADPRVCIGGGVEPAVRRAGRMGDAWVAGPEESPADLPRKLEWFEAGRAARAEEGEAAEGDGKGGRDASDGSGGRDAGDGDVVVRREALVLEDGERARELADEKLRAGYRGWPPDADWVLSGDAEDAAEGLAELAELGADEVVVRPMSGSRAAETLREVARARESLDL